MNQTTVYTVIHNGVVAYETTDTHRAEDESRSGATVNAEMRFL